MDLLNPAGGGGLSNAKLALADALAADVLNGKKFYAADKTLKVGTRSGGTYSLAIVSIEMAAYNSSTNSAITTVTTDFVPLYVFGFKEHHPSSGGSSIIYAVTSTKSKTQTMCIRSNNTVIAYNSSSSAITYNSNGLRIRTDYLFENAGNTLFEGSKLDLYIFGE